MVVRAATRRTTRWLGLASGALVLSGCVARDVRPAEESPPGPPARSDGALTRHGPREGVDPLPRMELTRPGGWAPAARLSEAPPVHGAVLGTNDDGVWVAALLELHF